MPQQDLPPCLRMQAILSVPVIYPGCVKLKDATGVTCLDLMCNMLRLLHYVNVYDASVVLHGAREVLYTHFEEAGHKHGLAAVLVSELYYLPSNADACDVEETVYNGIALHCTMLSARCSLFAAAPRICDTAYALQHHLTSYHDLGVD